MPGFEQRFEPVLHYETKPDAGGGSTIVFSGETGEEIRTYQAGELSGRRGHEVVSDGGTLKVANRGADIEIIQASIPENNNRGRAVRERAMVLLTFAMLSHDQRNGKWTQEERIFVNPDNEGSVDPSYLALLGIHRRRIRRLRHGEVQSEEVHIGRPVYRAAERTLDDLQRVQVNPAPMPADMDGIRTHLSDNLAA